MASDDAYVLGTHDEEIARLQLQHGVWRAHAHTTWRDAGFAPGQHIADIGSGPGFAALDLARLVGPGGRVTALDRSRRFLDVLGAAARAQAIATIGTVAHDLDDDRALPVDAIDGVWLRWALAFVRDPRTLLERIADRMRTPAAFAIHEYFDYATWRMMPPNDDLNDFVRVVMRSWRRSGGEPDIALSLPRWLEDLGFSIVK
jgi:SAM-dependent methyltransferase